MSQIPSQPLSDAILCLANGSRFHPQLLGNLNGRMPFHGDQPEALPGALVKARPGGVKGRLHRRIANIRRRSAKRLLINQVRLLK